MLVLVIVRLGVLCRWECFDWVEGIMVGLYLAGDLFGKGSYILLVFSVWGFGFWEVLKYYGIIEEGVGGKDVGER